MKDTAMPFLKKTTLTLAALLAAAGAWADTGAGLPGFDTSGKGCEAIEGYDPQWASHGLNYGAGRETAGGNFISGFYQIAGDGQNVHAAFAGMLTAERKPVPGVTPGALAVLDADTLALRRFIPLPFHAYALSVQPAQNRAVVAHTRTLAISIVDLASGRVRCLHPDTQAGKQTFRSRYVTSDADGNFYLGYYSGWGEKVRSTVAKFDAAGRPARSFTPQVTENAMALPILLRNGQVLTGSQSLVAVDARSGAVRRILPQNKGWSIYNYAPGPGDSLLAVNHKDDGSPNLWLLKPGSNSASAIFTGTGSLEAAHVPESAQVFATNFGSKTVTVAELPADGGALDGQRFVNIAFEGAPLGLYARRTAKGTEVFVTARMKGEAIHKITIAPGVQGIQGIEQPGACTVTSFDLKDQLVSAPQPCRVLDARASYAALQKQAQESIRELEAELPKVVQALGKARAELAQARRNKAGAQAVAKLRKQVESLEEDRKYLEGEGMREQRANLETFRRLAGG